MRITEAGEVQGRHYRQRWIMPVLIMALLALAVFLVMGLMLFYATWKEAHTPHPNRRAASRTPLR